MRLFYDKVKTKEVEEKIWQKYSNDKKEWSEKGYNCSELSGCEVKCYNNRTGMEQQHTKKNIGFLVFGIISEQIVMSIYPEDQRQCEANLNELVWGHMDAFEDHAYPIEGKATAKRIFKREQMPIIWIMQLMNYMVMTNADKGWLYILDIFTRTFSAWCLELTSDDRIHQSIILMRSVERIDWARKHKDCSYLIIKPEEYSLCSYKKTCERRRECRDKSKKVKKE